MRESIVHSYVGARQLGVPKMTRDDVGDYQALSKLGVNISPDFACDAADQYRRFYAEDATQQGMTTASSISVPVQFLQNWLPGFVNVIFAARKIDEFIGISTIGEWKDEEIVQGVLEQVGEAVPYGDETNVPLASYNTNFIRRTLVRFEKGIRLGPLEEARAAAIRINAPAEKRNAVALSLEVQRNTIGFSGYNSGNNLTYGFLNDPGLPNYVTVATGTGGYLWSQKTYNEIVTDLITAAAKLQTQSQDNINPEDTECTLAVPTNSYQYLSTVSAYGNSVRDFITKTYPKWRIVSAPQLNNANASANVFYLYADKVVDGSSDGSMTWLQCVPAKFNALGVQRMSKGYEEDYTNATAGVMLKRPWACVRYTGI